MAGEVLKKRREELGLDIKDVSELLKIRHEYLSLIEEDCFEKLPVAVYTLGYIRCYASYLNIDPEPIISSYTGNLSQPKSATIIPVASSKKSLPVFTYLFIAAAIALISATIYIVRQRSHTEQKVMTVRPEQKTIGTKTQPTPHLESPATTMANQSASSKQQHTKAGHRVTVYADEMTWMKIEFSGGRYEEVLLRPGTNKSWDFDTKAVLKIGNAGGVRMVMDDKDIGNIGSSGQVITLVLPEDAADKTAR